MRSAILLVACVAGAGCAVGDASRDLEESSLERAPAYPAMARINTRSYKSDLGAFSIDCYVAGDVAGYRKIHPERAGSNAAVARGTMIVRAVLDANQQVSKLTLMVKGPPGFDPSLGDWWFGVTDPHGAPLEENGAALVGRLTQCHGCHLDRAHDDFLFGVPSDDS